MLSQPIPKLKTISFQRFSVKHLLLLIFVAAVLWPFIFLFTFKHFNAKNHLKQTEQQRIPSTCDEHYPFLHVIMEMPYTWTFISQTEGYQKNYLKGRRKEEFEEALIRNLLHPAVEKLHAMWEDETGLRALQRLQSVYDVCGKMDIRLNKNHQDRMQYADALEFAQVNIPEDKLVLITNADLYLTDGWESLTPGNNGEMVLQNHHENVKEQNTKKRILMALSRFGNNGCSNRDPDTCEAGSTLGSHDAFLFFNPVPDDLPDKLRHPQNIPGAENVVVYEFKKKGYKICNPCLQLRMMHNHCTSLRKYAGKRINTKGRSGWAMPTDDFGKCV